MAGLSGTKNDSVNGLLLKAFNSIPGFRMAVQFQLDAL